MKSKNTVLTRYFWDKMLTETQNLQAELRALVKNTNFVASFIDDVSFVFDTDRSNTVLVTTSEPQQPAKTTETGMDSVLEVVLEQSKSTVEAVALAKTVLLNSIEAAEQQKNTVITGKVVVIAAEKPTAAEISFLNKILAAVTIEPTSVVYIYQKFTARELIAFSAAKIVLSFGGVTDFEPDHEVRSKSVTVIIAKSLAQLEQDIEAKKKLWLSMKGFFK